MTLVIITQGRAPPDMCFGTGHLREKWTGKEVSHRSTLGHPQEGGSRDG